MKRFLVALSVDYCRRAAAQTSIITATTIVGGDGVTPLGIGKVIMQPTDLNGNPLSINRGSSQGLALPKPVICHVSAGAITTNVGGGTCTSLDVSVTNPSYFCYKTTFFDTVSGWSAPTLPCVQPTGSTWSFDTYVPPAGPTALQVAGLPGPPGPAGPAGSPGPAGPAGSGPPPGWSVSGSGSAQLVFAPGGIVADGGIAADSYCIGPSCIYAWPTLSSDLPGWTATGSGSAQLVTAPGTVAAGTALTAPSHCIGSSCITAWPSGSSASLFPNPTVARNSGSDASGNSFSNVVVLLAGNSKVILDIGLVSQYCGFISTLFAGAPACRTISSITVDGSGNVTASIDNHDGYFQVGTRISITYNVAVDSGCLYDSYTVASQTATQIVFPTTGTAATCASGTFGGGNIQATTGVVKYGLNGQTLAGWSTSSSASGMPAMQSYIQTLIQKGKYPVVVMTDAGIYTNSVRTGAMNYSHSSCR